MRMREVSRCPHCGAKGVKLVEPLMKDGYDTDRPYCGACGKNYPVEHEPEPTRDNVTSFEDRR